MAPKYHLTRNRAFRNERESYAPHAYYTPPTPLPVTDSEPTEANTGLISRGAQLFLQGFSGLGGWWKTNEGEAGGRTQEEEEHDVAISGTMKASDIAKYLARHQCKNITDQLHSGLMSKLPLSGGAFGDVYRGQLVDKTPIAIKVARLNISSAYEDEKNPLKSVAREIHIWSKCQHPNVLPLLGFVQLQDDQIGIVSPWMNHGPLRIYLDNNRGADRCKISTQVCDGLSYLHEIGIIHGDLKGDNILVSNQGSPALADFGNAALRESTLQFTGGSYKSTFSARWAAPELIDSAGAPCTTKSDNYALGMTILEIITVDVPFANKRLEVAVIAGLMNKEIPMRPEGHIPPDSEHGDMLWSLLKSCWAPEPADRPSAAEIAKTMKLITQEGLTRSTKT